MVSFAFRLGLTWWCSGHHWIQPLRLGRGASWVNLESFSGWAGKGAGLEVDLRIISAQDANMAKKPTGLPVFADTGDIGRDGDRPNFLFICTDQLRADALAVNGHPIIQTPQIDQIALGGTNFQRAMSECPVCCPARRILMTGLDPFGINMFMNRDLHPFTEGQKVAELLRNSGYQTAGFGKFHTWPPRNGMGFEIQEVNEEGRTAGFTYPDDYQQFLIDEGLGGVAHAHGLGNNQYGYRPTPLPEYATTTGWTADRAMRFLRRRDPGRPFFLYVSFDKPHPPVTPPENYYHIYGDKTFPDPVKGDWVDKKPMLRRERQKAFHNWEQHLTNKDLQQETLRAYAACITHIDSRIGQILGTLRETGLLDNTWIFFTSDHGDACFDHELVAKGDFFNGSCHVPYLVRPAETWMDKVTPSSISKKDTATPVGLSDFAPTLCDLAGIPVPEGIYGRSLLPLFCEDSPEWRPYHFGTCQENYASTDGRWKYCWDGLR